jgi:hypothetical protein
MIAGSIVLALAVLSAPAAPDGEAAKPPAPRLLRVIAEQVSFEATQCMPYRWYPEDPGDPETPRDGCGGDDLQHLARYRVRLSIEGDAGEFVDFRTTSWTDFAESRNALLVLIRTPDGLLLPTGMGASVYPTTDGDWASCDDHKDSESLAFAGDLVFGRTDGMSAYGITDRFPASDYAVLGKEAFCIRGRRVPALMEDLDAELDLLRLNGYSGLAEPEAQAARP